MFRNSQMIRHLETTLIVSRKETRKEGSKRKLQGKIVNTKTRGKLKTINILRDIGEVIITKRGSVFCTAIKNIIADR